MIQRKIIVLQIDCKRKKRYITFQYRIILTFQNRIKYCKDVAVMNIQYRSAYARNSMKNL